MRELLIGYLMGALDPDEHAAVEQSLLTSESLQADLQHLDRSLRVLQEKHGVDEPEALFAPPGLASRTCERVVEQTQPVVTPAKLSPQVSAASTAGGWRLLDYVVAASVVIAAGMLVLPAINQSRFHSRLLSCQDNLRQVGRSLEHYSSVHNGLFPAINPGEIVGKYGPELVDRGNLEARNLICPNSPYYESECWNKLPSRKDLASSSDPVRFSDAFKHAYGYTLGYLQGGKVYPRTNKHDATYALVADAPGKAQDDMRSPNHGGCGQNVLFEDGHVRYVNGCTFGDMDDHIFKNARGQIAYGVHPDDSVIAPADFIYQAGLQK